MPKAMSVPIFHLNGLDQSIICIYVFYKIRNGYFFVLFFLFKFLALFLFFLDYGGFSLKMLMQFFQPIERFLRGKKHQSSQ